MKIQAIIPAAGTGVRFTSETPKQFVELGGIPLCVHTLKVFERSTLIHSTIVVTEEKRIAGTKELISKHKLKKVAHVIAGGKVRSESVFNGIQALDEDTDLVVVHDGVRPLVSLKVLEDTVNLCRTCDAVISAVPVKPTIKIVNTDDMVVNGTLDRKGLWEAQTPQVFRKDVLVKAHNKRTKGENPTDDAALVEAIGIKVKVLPGDYRNLKITTQEDLAVAETFLQGQGKVAVES